MLSCGCRCALEFIEEHWRIFQYSCSIILYLIRCILFFHVHNTQYTLVANNTLNTLILGTFCSFVFTVSRVDDATPKKYEHTFLRRFRLHYSYRYLNRLFGFCGSVTLIVVIVIVVEDILTLWYRNVFGFDNTNCSTPFCLKKQMNASWEYDRWVVKTQLCKLRDTSNICAHLGALVLYSICNIYLVWCLWMKSTIWLLILHFRIFCGRSFVRVQYFFLMKDIDRWLGWVLSRSTGPFKKDDFGPQTFCVLIRENN